MVLIGIVPGGSTIQNPFIHVVPWFMRDFHLVQKLRDPQKTLEAI
jgi:hypothetical protein